MSSLNDEERKLAVKYLERKHHGKEVVIVPHPDHMEDYQIHAIDKSNYKSQPVIIAAQVDDQQIQKMAQSERELLAQENQAKRAAELAKQLGTSTKPDDFARAKKMRQNFGNLDGGTSEGPSRERSNAEVPKSEANRTRSGAVSRPASDEEATTKKAPTTWQMTRPSGR